MGTLILAGFVPALIAAGPVTPDPVARWQPIIAEAARRTGLPERWIVEVMRAESGGRTMRDGRPIRSIKGAIGLMQLMPATWSEMRTRLGLGDDPDAPRDNILAGAFYLRAMYDRFGYPGLFGAYNAGPARYAAWLAGRSRLPLETVAYLARVGSGATPAPTSRPAPAPLFVALRNVGDPASAPSGHAASSSLFALRKVEP